VGRDRDDSPRYPAGSCPRYAIDTRGEEGKIARDEGTDEDDLDAAGRLGEELQRRSCEEDASGNQEVSNAFGLMVETERQVDDKGDSEDEVSGEKGRKLALAACRKGRNAARRGRK
jgi:hypothetical protein